MYSIGFGVVVSLVSILTIVLVSHRIGRSRRITPVQMATEKMLVETLDFVAVCAMLVVVNTAIWATACISVILNA
jgi:hypothetical protein